MSIKKLIKVLLRKLKVKKIKLKIFIEVEPFYVKLYFEIQLISINICFKISKL